MSLLTAKTLDLGDRHAGQTQLLKSLAHIIQFEGLNDRLNFFHRRTPLADNRASQEW
jgi:hypothetical protein